MLQMIALRLEMRSCLNSYNCAFGGQFPILLRMGSFLRWPMGVKAKTKPRGTNKNSHGTNKTFKAQTQTFTTEVILVSEIIRL